MTRELGTLEPMLKRLPKVHRLDKRSGCLWKKEREQNKKQTIKKLKKKNHQRHHDHKINN